MPRDGSGVYSHPFPDVAEGTTIESAVFNGNTSDVEQDLNTPRPIVAGGTGANNAHDAMIALSGEIASQGNVTNFDTYPFVSGSFYSSSGATAAPVVGNFIGTSVVYGDPTYVTLEAREVNSGIKYVRQKKAGVWGAWAAQTGSTADLDATYVNVAGDTMTGNLYITKGSPALVINKTAVSPNTIFGSANNLPRWSIDLGDAAPESGSNVGSNFYIRRYNDAGAMTGFPLGISRDTGNVSITSQLAVTGAVTAGAATAAGTYNFGNTGTKYLQYDGASFVFNGGPLFNNSGPIVSTYFQSQQTTSTGAYYFGSSGGKVLSYDGVNFGLSGGPLVVGNNITSSGVVTTATDLYVGNAAPATCNVTFNAGANGARVFFNQNGATKFQVGVAGGVYGSTDSGFVIYNQSYGPVLYFSPGSANSRFYANVDIGTGNTGWPLAVRTGGNGNTGIFNSGGFSALGSINDASNAWQLLQITSPVRIDNSLTVTGTAAKPGGGAWADSSDARIKNVLGDYTNGLDAIMALQPVRFIYKGNDTAVPPSNASPKALPGDKVDTRTTPTVPYPNSPHCDVAAEAREFIGLIAQQAEVPMPELVTQSEGFIDGQAVTDLRKLDQTPLIFALVNAVKTLAARIEALEATP